MAKKKETPGIVLNALLKKHGLNYSSLAKAIGLSGAMVRLIALDQNPVSADVAFRLAKFFKTSPEYWLDLQSAFNIAKAARDKKLAKTLKAITTVDKPEKKTVKPGRKPKAKKAVKKSKTAKAAKKTTGKRGRPAKSAAAKKAKPVRAAKKTTGKRGRPAGRPPVKKAARRGRPAGKAKKAKPAVKAKPKAKPAVPPSQPVNQTTGNINEPNI